MTRYLNLFSTPAQELAVTRISSANATPMHILELLNIETSIARRESSRPGTQISIIMSAYNAEYTIAYAIQSLLNQVYTDFELLIVDDSSTDQTQTIIRKFAQSDQRIIPILLTENRGAYACRNIALSRASGTFITTHDADDFCHPLRLSLQAEFLEQDANRVAVISQWLRIKENGEIIYHNKRGGDFLHGGLATMMYRHEIVATIGFYDEVRYSADTEYLFRIRSLYGHDSVGILRKPLVLAAANNYSLTTARESYTDSFLGDCKSRSEYRHSWEHWHQEESPRLYLSMNPVTRPFPAPEEMLSKHNSRNNLNA
ncbi:glycosyltransferase family 2 protein [Cyanobium sp. ATX 6A2]|uniref:glycosyltransferase family 2 protein n=1 Tax=Cyanobium sp. ATX 6A2 TaxID=2823700 RepID=UPI0020CDC00B|nr:glycosyltransferase family A protein [Cyanobium sp. ATX 6A2]MCP9887703.1 glycosyltransferase family 2 protein [Cyanobium sp. ATX 6A2]